MAKAGDDNEIDRLERLLAEHKKHITEMMLHTENLEAAIQLARQERLAQKEEEDPPPPTG